MSERTSALGPTTMLATSMHAQPGVYALLLGSGVSTGAGLPTGWGIVSELVRRIAAASGENDAVSVAEDDPETWWAEHGGGALGYSNLLMQAAPTAAARQGLLEGFFEAQSVDSGGEAIQPSAAHRAIAALVQHGYIRVIVTTNFDRLMEQALQDAGVAAQVVARPDAVAGMAPLAHATATVIKLHGDYKDLGSLNTPDELSDYPDAWRKLLAQVFDEYGLIVAGWSADWDTALVREIESVPNRRYPLYWDSRSAKGPEARRLLTLRGGQTLQAQSADDLFEDLLGNVEALERLAHAPLSAAVAVARVKRLLADPTRRIDLHDLLMDACAQVLAEARQPLPDNGSDGAYWEALYEQDLAAVGPLIDMVVAGIWHDPAGANDGLWIDVLQRLIAFGSGPSDGSFLGHGSARLWPALLTATAAGIACVKRGRERLSFDLAVRAEGRVDYRPTAVESAAHLLHANALLDDSIQAMPGRGAGRAILPASRALKADLRRFFTDYIPLEADFVAAFHGHEYRLGLVQEQTRKVHHLYGAVTGEYIGETAWTWAKPPQLLAEIEFGNSTYKCTDWPWGDLFDGDIQSDLDAHRDLLAKRSRELRLR